MTQDMAEDKFETLRRQAEEVLRGQPANLVDLSSISTMGSVGFLLVFATVNAANVKLARATHSKHWFSLFGVVLCLSALVALFWQTAISAPRQLWIPFAMMALSVFIEATFRLTTDRKISISSGKPDTRS